MEFILISQSVDPAITHDCLLQIAAALSVQIQRDFVPFWPGTESTVSVASADVVNGGLPADCVLCLIRDSLDAPGDLAYHDFEGGRPVIYASWGAIKSNGGTLVTGSNSLSSAISHEIVETLGDPSANEWVPTADGKKLAKEAADPVEGNSYDVDVPAVGSLPDGRVSASNFVKPAYFVIGIAGSAAEKTFDFMGMLSSSMSMDSGGYQILMSPDGTVNNIFGKTPEEGGTPQWKRDMRSEKSKLPGSRQSKRKKTEKPAVGAIIFHADGSFTVRSPHGTMLVDSTGFHVTPKEN